MRGRIPFGLTMWAVAALASAELSQKYRDWPSGPTGFLLTKGELKAYQQLATDDQAQAFIDLFWAKRDPDLSTPINEAKLELESRVARADSDYSLPDLKGSLSDRGKVLILMGWPMRIEKAGKVPEQGMVEQRMTTDKPTSETWCYPRPERAGDPKACDFPFYFIERTRGAGDFIIDRAERNNGPSLALLAKAPDKLLLHPDLKEPPKFNNLAIPATAAPEQLAVLDGPPLPWPAGAVAFTTSGLLSEAVPALWLSLQLPKEVPAASQMVARFMRSGTREVAGSFAAAVTPRPTPGRRTYEISLQAPAGNWVVEVALLADGKPLAGTSLVATVEAIPPTGTYLSPLYWGVDVAQDAEPHQGDAFNVGGWHVTPRLNSQYRASEVLSYFCYFIRPGVDKERESSAQVSMAVFQGQIKVSDLAPVPARLTRIFGDLWMVGSALPLESFKKSGFYLLEITLRDTVSNMSRTTRVPLRLAAAPAS